MRPKLLIIPRTTALEFEYAEGGVEQLLDDLQFEASERGIVLQGSSSATVLELLSRASLGLLRFRRDVRLIVSTLPQLLLEIRFDLLDWQNESVSARLFVMEKPPDRIKLLGWHLKQKSPYLDVNRAQQTEAAIAALQKAQRSD